MWKILSIPLKDTGEILDKMDVKPEDFKNHEIVPLPQDISTKPGKITPSNISFLLWEDE